MKWHAEKIICRGERGLGEKNELAMTKTGKACANFLIALLLNAIPGTFAFAQKIVKTFADVYPLQRRYVPVLDSSLNVAALSLKERNKLIEKIVEVDQMFRKSLNKIGATSESAEAKHYVGLMVTNDAVNQALLRKIIKLDGWPCDVKKGEKSLSYKAWFIVWHAGIQQQNEFYPYLKAAYNSNCMYETQFKPIDEAVRRVRQFQSFTITN
ncbi:hypothetical protein [Fibrella forsythiae]|uniref:Uncharacterized protein n=1 Tax=Fibrella forsythiae TaxID=2817061 RepID=A0ABS3JCP9_9BACT|nr:hypothetical protein [Fibrella forsythiae]MBO0947760.1 hypothetical protein [Fibrella forsythiae]